MTFARIPVQLPGSAKPSRSMRECDHCKHQRDQAGGIELRPGRWLCASCWAIRLQKKRN